MSSEDDSDGSMISLGFPRRVRLNVEQRRSLTLDEWEKHWTLQEKYCDFLESRCNSLQDLLLDASYEEVEELDQEEIVKIKSSQKLKKSNQARPSKKKDPSSTSLYVCGDCGKEYKYVSLLEQHRLVHTGERPHKCGECGKGFTSRSYMRLHRRTVHDGEQRPHQCTQCNKAFLKTGALYQHIHTVHLGSRPHVCSQCGKSYADRSTLLRHMLSHTGQRPFPCNICGKTFTRSSHLRRHQRIHDGVRNHKQQQPQIQQQVLVPPPIPEPLRTTEVLYNQDVMNPADLLRSHDANLLQRSDMIQRLPDDMLGTIHQRTPVTLHLPPQSHTFAGF